MDIHMSSEKQKELQDEIIQTLEAANCTVRQANAILTQAYATIKGTAAVQFVAGLDCEF